jgi:hypothetical protein
MKGPRFTTTTTTIETHQKIDPASMANACTSMQRYVHSGSRPKTLGRNQRLTKKLLQSKDKQIKLKQ